MARTWPPTSRKSTISWGCTIFPTCRRSWTGTPGTGAARLYHRAGPYAYRDPEARYPATPRHLAYLKIAEGCSHRCTYCVIPQIRGPYRSRPLDTLVAEAEALAAAGVRELILIAQDTTAYGSEQPGHPGLPALLQELGRLPAFSWIRLLYGHPARITPELLEVMAANPRLLPLPGPAHPARPRRGAQAHGPRL